MVVKGKIKKGEYFDSVTLMIVGKEISSLEGVVDAAVVMGTQENKGILEASDLLLPEFETANDTDLLVGVKLEDASILEEIFEKVDQQLEAARKKGDDDGDEFHPRSIENAIKALPDANIALISVAGKYAGLEAQKALEGGLHVMLFSDNVSLEDEITLKKMGREKGLLVMGPDCGTAIINGVPLAFANVVNPGDVGIIAASGTGLQEVSSIISNEGAGVSQAIGTGGRDVKKDVGGIMVIEALHALSEDDHTKVIVLVSKPPHDSVVEKIATVVKKIDKPVVAIFLGAEPETVEKLGMHAAVTLEEAALKAVALSRDWPIEAVDEELSTQGKAIQEFSEELAKACQTGQKYLRGLFSGGTFCAEAQLICQHKMGDIYSNATAGTSQKLDNALKSQQHTIIDLGEDEFTVGRPHPMIDFSLRNKRILAEADDPEVAIILLDVVLGYGSNMDPAGELVPVIEQASQKVLVICSITGTEQDPQNRAQVLQALQNAGAKVMPTNAAASRLAAEVIQHLD